MNEISARKEAYKNENSKEKGNVFPLPNILFYQGLNEILEIKWCNLD